ncbi:hypothetical protein QCA50_018221 [Cerrena zonata]|uniref:Uncharacterized protein n=1 Tax=Cerrena zonata TaxID=2478898 RepID=A0AAW0FDX4_9APHY
MEKIRDLVFKDSPATDDHFETKTEFGASDVQALNLSISKSNEFDPITTNGALDEVIADDGYAGVHVEDDSPYPEVRSAVPSTDDPSLPQNTIPGLDIGLAWLMLMIFLCLNLTNAKFPTWWGNSVIETPDYLGTAISDPIPSGGSVGPSLW